jgi:hypothetical protein
MKWHADEDQYFLTLTSSPKSSRDLYSSFHRLRIEMSRITPNRLVKRGYMSRGEALKWYPEEDWGVPLKFEYVKQHTSEGYGVLHIIFAGDHWPVTYLRDRWVKIHHAPQLVIRHIPANDGEERDKVVSYQIKQYLYKQNAYIRYSCSRRWLFPRYRAVWLDMVKTYGLKMLWLNGMICWNLNECLDK